MELLKKYYKRMKAFGKNYFLILLSASVFGCTAYSESKNETEQRNFVPVVKLTTQNLIIPHEYVSEIEAVKNVEIRVRIEGYLEKIYIDEGQEVKKDQLLFKINDEEYKAELSSANANLKNAVAEAKIMKLEVEKIKSLVEKNVLSKTELEVAKAKLEAANAKAEEAASTKTNAEIKLNRTTIKAPFDGVIDRIPFKIGSLVDEGTLLTTVSDVKSIYAYFKVSENEYLEYIKNKIENNDSNGSEIVELVLANGSNYPHKGKIETIEGEFEKNTGSIAFRAKFSNPDKILKHGATGKVRLNTSIENALLVPQKATFEIQDKIYVFSVETNNTTKIKSFVPASRYKNFYIVESGLKKDEIVVFEGIQSMKENTKIDPKMVIPNSSDTNIL
jgi:membrane fusion protein, multidrug efflux system